MAAVNLASYHESETIQKNELLGKLLEALTDRVNSQRRIIEDSHLFWLAFCNSFAKKKYGTHEFFVQKHNAQLKEESFSKIETIAVGEYIPAHLTIGGKWCVVQKIQKLIEELRVLLAMKLECSKPLDLMVVHIGRNRHLREKTGPLLDFRDWDWHKGIPAEYFDSYVMPLLPLFCRTLQLSMSSIKYESQEVWMADRIIHHKACEIFTISPKRVL